MEQLKILRRKAGMTQAEVASKLGVERSTYGKYETGQSEPNIEMMQKIAALFDVPIGSLLSSDADNATPVEPDLKDVEFALFHGFTKEEQDRLKEFDEDTLQDVRNFIRFTMEMKKKKDPKKNKE